MANKFEIIPNILETWLKNAEKIEDSYEKRLIGPRRKKIIHCRLFKNSKLPNSL